MDYSSDWVLSLNNEFVSRNQRKPHFISDWDISNTLAQFPNTMIEQSLLRSQKSSFNYLFADEQVENKLQMVELFKANGVHIDIGKITMNSSATASLYLSLLSLSKRGIKRFLVFTPVYYTILDTLRDLNTSIIYFPLYDSNEFKVDLAQIEEIVSTQEIDAIVFSDPIYSGGIEISENIFEFLAELSAKRGTWILCDQTLGGLEWRNVSFSQIAYSKISALLKTERFIFIDSISKRLLVNGLKISVVISSPDMILEIENLASQVCGGFNSAQMEFLKELYSPSNSAELSEIMRKNVAVMKDNHQKLSSVLSNTQYGIYEANSGYFTMIRHNEYKLEELDTKQIITKFLWEEELLAFPSSNFSFHKQNRFAFRVNVMIDLDPMILALENCIRKNVK